MNKYDFTLRLIGVLLLVAVVLIVLNINKIFVEPKPEPTKTVDIAINELPLYVTTKHSTYPYFYMTRLKGGVLFSISGGGSVFVKNEDL